MKIKIIAMLSICLASYFSSSAQIRLDPFYPYAKWTVGLGMGSTQTFGDLSNPNSGAMYRINIDHNSGPWASIGIEAQRGTLSDYQSKNDWTNGLSASNNVTAVDLNARVSLGALFNAPQNFLGKTLFGIYIGAGVGFMWNDVTDINTRFNSKDKYAITDYNEDNIHTTSSNLFVPVNVGVNLHLTKRCMFNANYQFSFAFSDYVDGYNFQPPTATNKYNDMFSVLSFGLNFYVGPIGTGSRHSNYRKRQM